MSFVIFLYFFLSNRYLCYFSFTQEEENFLKERDRYESEKARLIREMKRVRDEDGSRFNNFQVLNQRYALLNLLGKGGFSEVYKVSPQLYFLKLSTKQFSTYLGIIWCSPLKE